MIERAEKFVWILSNQVLASSVPYLVNALERGAEFRLLMPTDYMPSNDVRELVTHPLFNKAFRSKKLENRFLDRIDVFLCLSEREVAALSFPNLEGKFDYIGFWAEGVLAVEWAKTLYNYYWNKATSQIPGQLLNK
jgi:predicted transcriptional regulator